MMAWEQAGVQLAHNTVTPMNEGLNVPPSQIVPGDLVFIPGSDGSLAAPGHVGIYI
jgi:cell wall-associated NlpC family hydrolase